MDTLVLFVSGILMVVSGVVAIELTLWFPFLDPAKQNKARLIKNTAFWASVISAFVLLNFI